MDVKVIIWRGLAAALLDETRRNDGGPRGRPDISVRVGACLALT